LFVFEQVKVMYFNKGPAGERGQGVYCVTEFFRFNDFFFKAPVVKAAQPVGAQGLAAGGEPALQQVPLVAVQYVKCAYAVFLDCVGEVFPCVCVGFFLCWHFATLLAWFNISQPGAVFNIY